MATRLKVCYYWRKSDNRYDAISLRYSNIFLLPWFFRKQGLSSRYYCLIPTGPSIVVIRIEISGYTQSASAETYSDIA